MVTSKYLSTNTSVTMNPANFAYRGAAQAWQLTAANTNTRLTDIGFGSSNFVGMLLPPSLTLFVVAVSGAPSPARAPTNLRITGSVSV